MEIISVFFLKFIVPLLVLCVLIVVHEFGHFIVAKWCGVGVMKFSVGFGPVLAKWRRKETDYQLSLIPLGGYVRMVGDIPDSITGKQVSDDLVREESESSKDASPEEDISPELEKMLTDKSYWFLEKGYFAKSAIVFAGPLFNFILAMFLVGLSVLVYGETTVETKPILGDIMEGSPADVAGLKPNDRILSINTKELSSWLHMAEVIHTSGGEELSLTVLRDGQELSLAVTPKAKEIQSSPGETKTVYLMGVERKTHRTPASLGKAAYKGVEWTYYATMQTYIGLWGMIAGKISAEDLAGPIFILDAAGKQAKKGFEDLLYFMSILSVSLAVLNLLPIPVLDGGHLFFFTIEAVFGSISIRAKEMAQQVGVLFLIFLMVFALYNDVSRDPAVFDQSVKWEDDEPESNTEKKKTDSQENGVSEPSSP